MGTELNDFRSSTAAVHAILYQLEDDVIKLKCYLAKAVKEWNIRLEVAVTCLLKHLWFQQCYSLV